MAQSATLMGLSHHGRFCGCCEFFYELLMCASVRKKEGKKEKSVECPIHTTVPHVWLPR